MWRSHVSIIRGEQPKKEYLWKKHEGRKVEIFYSPDIRMSETYAWIPVRSPELEEIRVELGLKPQPRVAFHLTIGNKKNITGDVKKKTLLPLLFPWERGEVVARLINK